MPTAEQNLWITRTLGVVFAAPTPLKGMGPVKVGPVPKGIDRPASVAKPKSDAAPILKPVPPVKLNLAARGITIERVGNAVEFTAPPPPIRELNFSGGGGKGTALFGAAQALASGTMDGVREVNGASVGAMTSALLAAGITVDELQPFVDNEGAKADTISKITDGTMGKKLKMLENAVKNLGPPLTGEGMREVISSNMDEVMRKRIEEYQAGFAAKNGGQNDPVVDAILKKMDPKLGPTFQDMRDLSKIIKKIKDISVTGTYTKELDLAGAGGGQAKGKNEEGQLFIFSADTVPDMPVALAVQASAAFPMAFKPVDIDLTAYMRDVKDPATGAMVKDPDAQPWRVRFVDGGVMDNTPTAASIGNDKPLDPMPQERSMTFVFEGSASADVLKGGKPPRPGGFGDRFKDKLISSKNWAAEYALSIDAQEHAQDFVVVPLKFSWKKPDGKIQKVDMSGTFNGTLNFNADKEQVAEIRKRTREATEKQLEETAKPVKQSFANDTQMMMAIGLDDLKALSETDPPYPQAKECLAMRGAALNQISATKGQKWADTPKDREAQIGAFLQAMDKLSAGDKDKEAFIAREIHKAGIDQVIDHAGDKDLPPTGVGKAVGGVNEAKKVFAVATRVLKTLIYPKMRDEKPDGASIGLLEDAAKHLRQAEHWAEVKSQFTRLAEFYRGKSDKKRFILLPGVQSHGHEAFYKALVAELSNVERMSARA